MGADGLQWVEERMGVVEVTANINDSQKLGGEGLLRWLVTDVLSITTVPFSDVYLLLEVFVTPFMLCATASMLNVQMGSSTASPLLSSYCRSCM